MESLKRSDSTQNDGALEAASREGGSACPGLVMCCGAAVCGNRSDWACCALFLWQPKQDIRGPPFFGG